jgi:hypothetical protein
MNTAFIVLAVLTFFNLYKDIIWLSCVLAVMFLLLAAVHVRDYRKENPKNRKVFILTLIISVNFLLANAVIVISEYVYPY